MEVPNFFNLTIDKNFWKSNFKRHCPYLYEHSRLTKHQGKRKGRGGAIQLTPRYHFHPLCRHLDISREITKESSPMEPDSKREPLESKRKSLITAPTLTTLSSDWFVRK